MASRTQGRDKSCVVRELGTTPQQEAVCDGDDRCAGRLGAQPRGHAVLTVAPASRQTRAAALSSGIARGRNKPERGKTHGAPYQRPRSIGAGAEALARALRMATDMSTSTTVVSVDGVGAYNHICKRTFDGPLASPALAPLISLVRFCCLFYDASGADPSVLQSKGGEQGDLLMPRSFAVGIHQALRAAHSFF